MVFPVVMYGCESWTIKQAECWRIDAFELCCWRRLLRVPWKERRSSHSILKGISPEYSLEGSMLKLKLQYFGHLMSRTDTLEKTLMQQKIEGSRRRGWQRTKLWCLVDREAWACCSPWGYKESDMTDWLNWTELNHPDGQNSTLISVGSVLVTASTMGMMGRTYIPRTEKEVRHLWLPRSSLMVNKNVHPLDNFLQELIEINAANKRNKEHI